ncbi:caspase-3-like [Branchiostoma floridae x Branchiostoma belcheri]
MEYAYMMLHRQLFETINKEMDDEDFRSFLSIAQAVGLRLGEASKCKTATDALDKLQRKGKIKLGCYRALKDIFIGMEQENLIEVVADTERKLEERGCEISDEIPQFNRHSSSSAESGAETGRTSSSSSSTSCQHSVHSFDSSTPPHPRQHQSREQFNRFEDRDIRTEDPVVLEDREDCYRRGRGFVLLINNFSENREASSNDVDGLVDFFMNIGYKINTEEDLTKEQMIDALDMAKLEIQKTARRGKNKYSSFICIVSSHGDKEGVKSQDNQTVSIAELQAPFLGDKLPCMAGSPKMFIIQACRRDKKQPAVDRPDEEPGDEGQPDMSDAMRSVTTPKDADVLVAYATTEGFQAFRRVGEGSWFLSKMLKVFNAKHQTDHLSDMLIEVNNLVSHCTAVGPQPAKQMPCQVTTLTKKFFF